MEKVDELLDDRMITFSPEKNIWKNTSKVIRTKYKELFLFDVHFSGLFSPLFVVISYLVAFGY